MSDSKMLQDEQRLINKCPLGCHAQPEITRIGLEEGALRRCPDCAQLFSNCTMAQYEAALWKWDTASGTSPDAKSVARHEKVTRRRLKGAASLLRTPSNPASLLDVGCSSGALLGIAKNMGFEVSGVEPAARAAQTAKGKGFNVFQGYLKDAGYQDNAFDVITLFELLEHIAEPVELLAECRRILKPGGIIILNTPNAASWTAGFMREHWDGFSLKNMGGHISFFSPRSIRLLGNRAKLEVVKIETRNVRFFEKENRNPFVYRFMKTLAELLALPAMILGKGHDLLVYMRKADAG